jgi:hypothetical protein
LYRNLKPTSPADFLDPDGLAFKIPETTSGDLYVGPFHDFSAKLILPHYQWTRSK